MERHRLGQSKRGGVAVTIVEELAILLFAELYDDNRMDSELEIITRILQAAYDEGAKR